MGSQLGLLSRSKDYTKVILYHLTFSLYALWGFKVCYIRLKWRGTSKEWLFVKMDQGFLTCFLLMIVCFFVEQKRRNVRRFWIFWLLMREGRVRKLIETKPIFFFSTNTSSDIQSRIQSILGVPAIRQYEKYLGLPALVGGAKKQSFIYIKERVWKKL